MTSPRVKICGITNEADAAMAAGAGADALGFNLYKGSRRYTPLAELAPWLPGLAGKVTRVGVMVDPGIDEIREAAPYFDVIQLHGREAPAFCKEAAGISRVWKALPLTAGLEPGMLADYGAEAFLIDTAMPGAFGGTGQLIDLQAAAAFIEAARGLDVWLSGGLGPGNVGDAIRRARPYGVDAASGVETPGNPRRKDAARVAAFVAGAKSANSG